MSPNEQPTSGSQQPTGITNSAAQLSVVFAVLASVIYVVSFSTLWLPAYFAGSGYNLYLWPIAILALFLCWLLAILAIIWGGVGMNRSDTTGADGRSKAVAGLVVGLVLLVLGGPVLWFGNLPIVLLTGEGGYGV